MDGDAIGVRGRFLIHCEDKVGIPEREEACEVEEEEVMDALLS